jgi:hypothetical protein
MVNLKRLGSSGFREAEELGQVLSYIDDRSPLGARRVKARLRAVIDLIASHPQSGQLTSARRLRLLAEADERLLYPIAHLLVCGARQAHPARLGDPLDPGGEC